MPRIRLFVRWLCALPLMACGGGDDSDTSDVVGGELAITCDDQLAALYASVEGLPPLDESQRGEVVRCARVGSLSAQQIADKIRAAGGDASSITSGADAYVIAYRTSRLDAETEGVTAALVYVPQEPAVSGPQPLVVFGHGTVGLGDECAPSRNDPLLDNARIGLVGRGFTVIAPDYAGYGYGGEPPGFLSVPDQGHSLLDATRAARKLLPEDHFSEQNVLVGHSQGGHAVLGAQTLAADYGVDGVLSGVAAFAPVWFPIRTFAAVPLVGAPSMQPFPYAFAALYLYSHGELIDGAGQGGAIFNAARRDEIVGSVADQCLMGVGSFLGTLGAPSDLYDETFLSGILNCAGFKQSCDNAVAEHWMPRFADDRPPIDGSGAPMVIWQGGMDATVTPDRARCGVDKITSDLGEDSTATLTTCVNPEGTHGSVVYLDMDWVTTWILARTTGSAEPAACLGAEALPPCPDLPAPTNED